jgi:uncharacterized protein YihD (DUF1040 family)
MVINLILINEQEKNSLISVLNNLKSSVNNLEFKNMINDVKDDITIYSNRTTQNILDNI